MLGRDAFAFSVNGENVADPFSPGCWEWVFQRAVLAVLSHAHAFQNLPWLQAGICPGEQRYSLLLISADEDYTLCVKKNILTIWRPGLINNGEWHRLWVLRMATFKDILYMGASVITWHFRVTAEKRAPGLGYVNHFLDVHNEIIFIENLLDARHLTCVVRSFYHYINPER